MDIKFDRYTEGFRPAKKVTQKLVVEYHTAVPYPASGGTLDVSTIPSDGIVAISVIEAHASSRTVDLLVYRVVQV